MPQLPDVTSYGGPPQINAPGGRPRGMTYQPVSGHETDVTRGLQQLGGTLTGIDRELDQVDQVRAEDAFTKLRARQLELSTGDNGFVQKRGGDAVNQPLMQDYGKQFDGSVKELSDSLANDRQRSYFARRADIAKTQFDQDILNHVNQQKDIYNKQVLDGGIDVEVQNANQRYADTMGVALSKQRVNGLIDQQASRLGLPGDEVDKLKRKANTEIDRAVINGYINSNDTDGANLYFKQNAANMDESDRTAMQEYLKKTTMPVDASKLATAIMGPDMPSDGSDMRANQMRSHLGYWLKRADAEADRIHPNDPLFSDMVKAKISGYANRIAAAEQATSRNARDVLFAAAMGDENGNKPTDMAALLSTPELKRAWSLAEPETQIAINNMLEKNSNPPMNDKALGEYYRLKGMSANDPGGFLDYNLMKDAHVLPHHLLLDLMNLQSSVDKGEAKDRAASMNMQHAMGIAKPMLLSAGVAIPNKPGEKAKVYDEFAGRMSEQLEQFVQNNKRKPNDKEIRDMAGHLLVSGAQAGTGWFFEDKVRAFQSPDLSKFYVPVPDTERQKIIEAYKSKKNGAIPTDAEITRIYTAAQLGTR